ncbi:DEAD/DEAH box helicase [Amycolatopsis sp. YIM 10]|uniref:DEAD/DEAH box helicase n=1 Tax=Amycolatopsis sp. YIM 10 TaxID=2653857 RepID=UPI0012AA0A85|nr:DEAD/DEAH box helicase [Amycolatopsis sp. YIM 10]QFU85535.1 hypothetical protein YIM_01525 [Amycolatopsis sp. YIM 10]
MPADLPEPSLNIGFDITRTQARLRTTAEYKPDLGRLLASFPAGRMSDLLAATIPIEGFLAGLGALAEWPDPAGVTWEEQFRAVVEEMLNDADRAERQLAGDLDELTVSPDEVLGLLGEDWLGDLTSFQQRDAAALLSLGHSANFSVPGAGKTRVALAVYAALRQRGDVSRLLVVSPKSAYEAWQFEASVCFGRPPRVHVLSKRIPAGVELVLVNYERLHRLTTELADWLESAPTMMILDEAHRIKLGGAGVYGAASLTLGPLSRVRMIMTGTPAPNGAKDLESLLAFVWPGRGRRVVTQAIDGGNLAHASRVLKPLYTRTTKHELGLPPVTTVVRQVEMPRLHREIYDAIVGRFTARAERARSDFEALGNTVLRLLMAATSPALLTKGSTRYEPLSFQVPPLEIPQNDELYALLKQLPSYEIPPKYQETLAVVAENAARGRKTLVWSSFVRSIMTLEVLLKEFFPAVVHGGTLARDEQIQRFREDPDCAVLVSNPATLGEGISLHQVCHDAVYVDRDFQAGRFLQSLDRIHRLGLAADTETRVTVLAARETIDDVVADRLKEKLDFMGRILDDPSVRQLGDPEEEQPLAAGMDMTDVRALMGHFGDSRD